MAKGKIFIGEIMADQVSALSSMQSAMSAQTGKMTEMVNNLISLGQSNAQSVDVLKIQSSTLPADVKATFPAVGKAAEELAASTFVSIGSFKSVSYGTFSAGVAVSIRKQSSPATLTVKLAYRINGGAVVIPTNSNQVILNTTNLVLCQLTANDIPIDPNTVIEIGWAGTQSGVTVNNKWDSGCGYIRYKLKDIVSESGLIPL